MRPKFFTSEAGSSVIEFALVALPFFTLLLVILEIALSTLRQQVLDDTNFKLTRCASIIGLDSNPDRLLTDQICPANLPFIACERVAMGAATLGPGTSLTNDAVISSWNVGAADDIIVIELRYPYEPIVPFLKIVPTIVQGDEEFTFSRNLVRNEPNPLTRSRSAC